MPKFDVIGLGSLNVDSIAPTDEMSAAGRREVLKRFERGAEIETDNHEQFLETLALTARKSRVALVEAYGGSSFNFIRALRQMAPDLELGYAGTLGRVETTTLRPHHEHFRSLGIDCSGVVDHDGPGGKSLSIVEEDTRSLLTFYDEAFLRTLTAARKRLVKYLSGARIVHVSSFLGPGGPSAVLSLLEEVTEANDRVRFSVDPGTVWARAAQSDPAVKKLLKKARYIFVNHEELAALGRTPEITPAATRLFEETCHESAVLLLKQWNQGVRFHWDRRSSRAVDEPVEQSVLPITQIADSTGAGDVFAAGYIAGERSKRARRSLSMRLGLAAARHRLQHVGDSGYEELGEVVTGQWVEDTGTDLFVSHAALDHELADRFIELLEYGAGVPTRRIYYTSLDTTGVAAGHPVAEDIRRHLAEAKLVIMLVTPAYLASQFCRYEFGGAWALDKTIYPLRLPSVKAGDLSELQRSRQAPLLYSPGALTALHEHLTQQKIAQTDTAVWERHARRFVKSASAPGDDG